MSEKSLPKGAIPSLAKKWLDQGRFIKWRSTLDENQSFGELDIFTIEKGDRTKPAILMIHGYPTSSFDFSELFDLLSQDYYVCAIDTPGYGFSDKPQPGYHYTIEEDAKLVDFYIKDVLELSSLTLLTHDKGNSVGLALLGLYNNQTSISIKHHIITNGNIYLPLANLTAFQKLLLSHKTGPIATKIIGGGLLAHGLNRLTHNFKENPEKVKANAFIFNFNKGMKVQYDIIQYLNQRKQKEISWLENLAQSKVSTTLIWGEDDHIAPIQVADYVWENVMKQREAESVYWRLPHANHYLQNDRPEALNKLIRWTQGEKIDFDDLGESEKPYRY